jgi:hypothetical protein
LFRNYLFFVKAKFGEEVVLLDNAFHACQQREERVLGVKQHFALTFILSLFLRYPANTDA